MWQGVPAAGEFAYRKWCWDFKLNVSEWDVESLLMTLEQGVRTTPEKMFLWVWFDA